MARRRPLSHGLRPGIQPLRHNPPIRPGIGPVPRQIRAKEKNFSWQNRPAVIQCTYSSVSYHSGDFMLSIYLQRVIDSATVADLRAAYLDAMGGLGFRHTLYAARFLLTLPAALSRDKTETYGNFPQEFDPLLKDPDLLARSVWLRWSARHSGTISTRNLYQDRGKSAQDGSDKAFVLARRLGLEAGQVISLRDPVLHGQGAVLLIPFAGATHDDVERRWAVSHQEITALSWVMHLRMAGIRQNGAGQLTPRQREVLEWSSTGKTVTEIGTIIGVSAATIEKHLRLARNNFAADSTAQAVLKAHLSRQLFTRDPSNNPPQ
ncbi:helix-turn-helix transcriptional regulator [Paracoccus marinaquae]|uniref:helix-turn-helix transcriptional regulator n=1 Tax=Paracoccus marinaquae TaxID=2841926 RepID=UPI001C09153F|nr:autoinducer binding domain-containing protein [Paracoccus marinaquae]